MQRITKILWLKREGQGEEIKNQYFLENKHLKAEEPSPGCWLGTPMSQG